MQDAHCNLQHGRPYRVRVCLRRIRRQIKRFWCCVSAIAFDSFALIAIDEVCQEKISLIDKPHMLSRSILASPGAMTISDYLFYSLETDSRTLLTESYAEIAQLESTVFDASEHIFRFDIEMNDPMSMKMSGCLHDVDHNTPT